MKNIITIFCLLAAITVKSQTLSNNVPPLISPTPSQSISNLLNSFANGLTNCDIIPYGLYAKGLPKHYGGGLAVVYPFSDNILVATRIDYINGDFWMPSGNATLQLPLHPFSWLTVTPFTFTGIGVPVSGATVAGLSFSTAPPKNNDGQPTAILGMGLGIDLYHGTGSISKVSFVGDVEQWTGFPGKQYRTGLAFKFGKW